MSRTPSHPTADGSARPFIAQLITRLILGGAQETAVLTAEKLGGREGLYPTELFAGPETGPEGSLWEDAAFRSIRSEIVPSLVRDLHPPRDLAATRWLERRFRLGARSVTPGDSADVRIPFTIVHTHSSKAGVLGRIAARRAGVPRVVHTVHGWPFHDGQADWLQALYRLAERRAARRTDCLVCVSERDVEKGLAAGIGRPEQYRVIRSGIELGRFHPDSFARGEVRAEFGIPADAAVVGAVTRLSPQKAPEELVRILTSVLERTPGAWAMIVGDGPSRPQVEKQLGESQVGTRVVLTGIRHDAPRLFSALDVFVLPSRWEGLPRTLPQAMSTGLPIVCSQVDGNAEAVREGLEGFLFRPGDVESAVRSVLDLLTDPSLRARIGEAGRFRAAEFDAERMIAGLSRLYGELSRLSL